MTADGLTLALEDYQRAQDELVEARNRLARAIAGAAMSGMTKDEIVDQTGYPPISCCGSAPMPASAANDPAQLRRHSQAPSRPIRKDLVTDAYALVTDVDAGTCDELLDLLVALAAERTLDTDIADARHAVLPVCRGRPSQPSWWPPVVCTGV
jgi:hypothetical protein